MKPIPFAVCLALASCHSSPAPTPAGTIPGLQWMTAAQPWHLPHPLFSFAADGDVGIVGSRDGWLTRFDLRSGRVVTARQIGTHTNHGLVALGGGRWLVLGLAEGKVVAFVVDGETLTATQVALAADPKILHGDTDVARLPDGGIVIGSKAMPLAIYDPTTFKVRTVIAPEVGWTQLKAHGNVVAAYHDGKAYRFDLATKGRTEFGKELWFDVSATLTATSRSAPDDDDTAPRERNLVSWFGADAKRTELPDRVEKFAFDDSGTRLVTTHTGAVWIHAMPSGAVTSRVDLGVPGHQIPYWLQTDGDRAFTLVNNMLRVIDLTTGTVTPGGDPVWGAADQIAVGNDGKVLVLGPEHSWQLANGKINNATPFTGLPLGLRAGDPAHFLTELPARIELHRIDGSSSQSWSFDHRLDRLWSSGAGFIADLAISAEFDGEHVVVRSKGAATETLLHHRGNLEDADPETGDLLFQAKGVMHVLRLPSLIHGSTTPPTGHKQLRIPNCEDIFVGGSLERRGKRAATWSEKQLALWDRTTGLVLGIARFDDEILEVSYLVGRDEVLVSLHDHLVLWSPGHEARTLDVPGLVKSELSPDGHRLAIGFHDSRVALINVDALHAGLPPGMIPGKPPLAATCPTHDPLVPEPDEPVAADPIEPEEPDEPETENDD